MITKIYKSKQRKSTWQNLRKGILIFIFFASMNSAKALVANYAFASSVSNYSTLAGATFVTGTWDDSSSALITLPFTFNYNNTNYTTLSINTNGYVTFGAVPATVYCGLQSSAPNTIAAYGTDLIGNAGSTIQYGSRGALPSRQFVIQWADCEHYLNGGVNHWNFQIILNEGTNTVQVVWGASTDVTTMGANLCNDVSTESGSVGILGAAQTDFNIREVTNGSNTWATSISGANLASVCNLSSTNIPVAGQTYTWTPGVILPMAFTSCTTVILNNGQSVAPNTTGNQIIQVQVNVNGSTSPFNLTSLSLSTAGSTSALADISNAKVYYTGITNIFSTTTQFGSTVGSPNGAYTVNGSITLVEGVNYFWIAYDVKSTAVVSHILTGCCSQLVGSGTLGTRIPTVTCPSGNQIIASVGTWTPLTNLAPSSSGGLMLLLSDGTVMAKSQSGGGDGIGNVWNRLTPSSTGSYINGTWSSLAPMVNTRLYFSSQILKDGRVYVAGGEYGTGIATGEVYNPVTNSWTSTPAPGASVSDANSEILDDGRVLQALVAGSLTGTIIYNPTTNTYGPGPTALGIHNESAWLKLPDNSILYINRLSTASERYIPATNTWVNDGTVPVQLYDAFGDEAGGAVLLPDGRALFLGSSGHNAYYTPSGNASPGVWAAAPDFPSAKGTPDAPVAMMANGKILCAVSPVPTAADHFPSPTTFYEFDYLTNTFTLINAPGGGTQLSHASYITNMLNLPDGNILFNDQGASQYYVYTPSGTPIPSGKPIIAAVAATGCTSYKITGTQFNGISQGSGYGDDWQMATNYPVIRLTFGANVYYVRSYNWNSTGVKRGAALDTAFFDLPAGLPAGTYSLVVTANGIASDPVTFTPGSTPTLSSSLTPPAICTNTAFTYAPTSSSAGATFTWTRAAVTGISNAAVTVAQGINPNEVLINTTTTPKTVVYTYVITVAGCGSNTQSVSIIVNPLPIPSVINAGGNTTFCSGGAVLLSGNSTGGTWSIGGGVTSTLSAVTSGDYFVTTTNSCGSTASNHIIITVNSLPIVNMNQLALSYDFLDPVVALTGTPVGGTFSGPGVVGNTFAPSVAGVGGPYSIVYNYTNVNGCSGNASQSTSVTNCVLPAQPSTIFVTGGTAKVCPGDVRTFKVATVIGATSYLWTVPTGAIITSGQGTFQITVSFNSNFTAAGNVTVSSGNGCGNSFPTSKTVSRNTPSQTSVITGIKTGVCANTSSVYSVTNVTGLTYNWTAPLNASILSGQGTNSVTVSFGAAFKSGTITVFATNTCGSGSTRSLSLTSKPATPAISGLSNVTSCIDVTYTTPVASGATSYLWTVPFGNTIVSGQGTTSILVHFGAGSGNVTVKGVNACGNGASSIKAVTVGACLRTSNGIASSTNVNVYPNPSSGKFTLEVNTDQEKEVAILINDVLGREILNLSPKMKIGVNSFEIDLSGYAKGVYYIQIKDSQSRENLRIVVQ